MYQPTRFPASGTKGCRLRVNEFCSRSRSGGGEAGASALEVDAASHQTVGRPQGQPAAHGGLRLAADITFYASLTKQARGDKKKTHRVTDETADRAIDRSILSKRRTPRVHLAPITSAISKIQEEREKVPHQAFRPNV